MKYPSGFVGKAKVSFIFLLFLINKKNSKTNKEVKQFTKNYCILVCSSFAIIVINFHSLYGESIIHHKLIVHEYRK